MRFQLPTLFLCLTAPLIHSSPLPVDSANARTVARGDGYAMNAPPLDGSKNDGILNPVSHAGDSTGNPLEGLPLDGLPSGGDKETPSVPGSSSFEGLPWGGKEDKFILPQPGTLDDGTLGNGGGFPMDGDDNTKGQKNDGTVNPGPSAGGYPYEDSTSAGDNKKEGKKHGSRSTGGLKRNNDGHKNDGPIDFSTLTNGINYPTNNDDESLKGHKSDGIVNPSPSAGGYPYDDSTSAGDNKQKGKKHDSRSTGGLKRNNDGHKNDGPIDFSTLTNGINYPTNNDDESLKGHKSDGIVNPSPSAGGYPYDDSTSAGDNKKEGKKHHSRSTGGLKKRHNDEDSDLKDHKNDGVVNPGPPEDDHSSDDNTLCEDEDEDNSDDASDDDTSDDDTSDDDDNTADEDDEQDWKKHQSRSTRRL